MNCCIFDFCEEEVLNEGPSGWTCADHDGQVPEAE